MHSVEAERLTREAAYNMAKDSVTEWQPFVARLNSMEFVSFPLMDTSVSNQRLNSINELASTHEVCSASPFACSPPLALWHMWHNVFGHVFTPARLHTTSPSHLHVLLCAAPTAASPRPPV